MWSVIRELVNDGTTLLLTTQYLEEADQLAKRIVVLDHGNVIAQGTANELKSQVGGDRIVLDVTHTESAQKAFDVLTQLASEPGTVDTHTGKIVIPVSGGSAAIVSAVRILDENKIEIADIALRRPTLDDVFLSLTGRVTESENTEAPAQSRRGRRGGK